MFVFAHSVAKSSHVPLFFSHGQEGDRSVRRVCTIWFVEIHLQIIRLRSQYASCYYYCCCFPPMTKVFFEKRLEFTDQKLTSENAVNSCLCIFIDILAPIHLVNFIVTDGHWNAWSQNIPGVQVCTHKLESEWAFACVYLCYEIYWVFIWI